MDNIDFKFHLYAKIGLTLFERDQELYFPDNLKKEPDADKYYEYAQLLKEELSKVKIVMHDPVHLKPAIIIKIYLFSPKKNGHEVINHHIEIIVDNESRLFVFEDISNPLREVRDTIIKIKQYIYDMELVRLQEHSKT